MKSFQFLICWGITIITNGETMRDSKEYPSLEEQIIIIKRLMTASNLYYSYVGNSEYAGKSMRYVYDEDPAYLYERYQNKLMTVDELRAYRSF